MAGILEYSSTAASNTAINGIGIQGSSTIKNGDDALRQLMADQAAAITRHVAKAAGTYTAVKADYNQLWRATGAVTLNLTAAATLTDGWCLWVKADGGAVTVDPNGAETINGAATLSLPDGFNAFIVCTGTAFFAVVFGNGDVTLNGVQTLINKTLTSPTINTPTISGGSWSGGTDLAIADGGTGASTAAAAFANLKQAASDTATGVVELATAAEVATGTDTGRVPSVSTMGSHQGVAKAWVCFNGTGTVAITDSYNVTSITDNGVGDYTVSLSITMANANYAAVASGGIDGGAGRWVSVNTVTTTTVRVGSYSSSGTKADANPVSIAVFGD